MIRLRGLASGADRPRISEDRSCRGLHHPNADQNQKDSYPRLGPVHKGSTTHAMNAMQRAQ